MQAACRLLFVLLCAGLAHAGVSIEKGMTEHEVIAALGTPEATIDFSDRVRLYYPRGSVTLVNSRVEAIDLQTEAAYAAEQKQQALYREEWAATQAKMSARRIEEGENLKRYRLQSSAFASLSAGDQLEYWRAFQRKFPEVDVSAEIALALKEQKSEAEARKREIEALRQREQIKQLEARVAQAEREASEAKAEAANARRSGLRVTTYPLCPPAYTRPVTPIIITHPTGTTNRAHYSNYQTLSKHPRITIRTRN